MRVDVWSDVVCPWCAIGKANLERALERFDEPVEVVWRSFELDPGAPDVVEGEHEALLARRYGTSRAGARALVGRISAAAEHAGVQARFDLVRPARTFDAHRLLHAAREQGRQGALKTRLLAAYLAEGAVLSDPGVLQRLAADAGVEGAAEVLAGDRYAAGVRADQAEAARREITAVPTLLVDGRWVVPGAQSPDTLLRTLLRAARP